MKITLKGNKDLSTFDGISSFRFKIRIKNNQFFFFAICCMKMYLLNWNSDFPFDFRQDWFILVSICRIPGTALGS